MEKPTSINPNYVISLYFQIKAYKSLIYCGFSELMNDLSLCILLYWL